MKYCWDSFICVYICTHMNSLQHSHCTRQRKWTATARRVSSFAEKAVKLYQQSFVNYALFKQHKIMEWTTHSFFDKCIILSVKIQVNAWQMSFYSVNLTKSGLISVIYSFTSSVYCVELQLNYTTETLSLWSSTSVSVSLLLYVCLQFKKCLNLHDNSCTIIVTDHHFWSLNLSH